MATYALRLLDPNGGYVAELDVFAALDCAQPTNAVGALTLVLPPLLPFALLRRDSRLLLERTVGGLTRSSTWLVRRAENALIEQGSRQRRLTAVDPRDLLRRHIVPVVSQATQTGPADDVMKQVVRDNFVTASNPDRILSQITVAADTGSGPTVTMEFPNRTVLQVLQDLAAASLEAGTYLAFDMVPVGAGFEFRTYPDVWGTDRRDEVLLSAERGTLSAVSTVLDWANESTVVYTSGRGEGNAALTTTAIDTARVALSPFGRIETYLNASSATTTDALQFAANARLQEGRPREQFAARLVEQPGMRYGLDVSLGDLVRAEYDGTFYDCRVEPVRITLDGSGKETVDVQLRNIA